ncbi:hypothetical protein [Streptacidiphilus jiangxiensis]|uniref:Hydrophobic protein n=1 Tax=Streptacidiphilus jiangxiensis TaxID=235985 RepID=A0A1H7W8Y8_STRJI|nr:hypothetical protein [Streptacidiphilus jiangxiensis]SEM17951.1 hypothetical protein SAMN05414137_1205 [Streptacidiphilus jiangxiensis]
MVVVILVLLLALILGGARFAFAVHALWWIALAVLALWLLGFLFRTGEGVGGGRRRWYRW